MLPDVGRSMPHTILSSVDFPAPFGPKRPYTVPSGTCSEHLSTAACPLNVFVSASVSNMYAISFPFSRLENRMRPVS